MGSTVTQVSAASSIPPAPGIRTLIAAVVALVCAVLVIVFLPEARNGNGQILALELVGDAQDAEALGLDRKDVALGFVADLFFIVFWVLVLRWLVLWAGRHYRLSTFRSRRRVLGWAVVGAGVADLLEDTLLLAGLASGYESDGVLALVWPLAAAMAWAKFLTIAAATAYVLGGVAGLLTTPRELRELLWSEEVAPERPPVQDMSQILEREPAVMRRKLGIALSGGGVRSASIALGTLQALERPGSSVGPPMGWWEADEVTAISGGSYMAGAWSISRTTRQRRGPEGEAHTVPGQHDAWAWGEGQFAELSVEEKHLLENLGYLASRTPRGATRDPASPSEAEHPAPPPTPSWRPSAYATVLAGFLLNTLVLLACVWLLALPAGWLFGWLSTLPQACADEITAGERVGCLAGQPLLVFPTLFWLGVGLIATVAWVGAGRVSNARQLLSGLRSASSAASVVGAVMFFALVVFPYLMRIAGLAEGDSASLLSGLGALGSLGAVVRILRKPLVKLAPVVGGLAFGALVLFLAAYWAHTAAVTEGAWASTGRGWWLLVLLLLVTVWAAGSPEMWSLAPFYRGRLRRAYALRRRNGVAWPYGNDAGEEVDEDSYEPSLHEYLTGTADTHTSTPLTICASCTVSTRGVRTHYGIPAMSTTFTPRVVTMYVPEDDLGSWRSWTCDTETMDRLCRRSTRSRLTTMLAVAVSGAAVSPAMGRFRIGPTSMLLTFANIRLGLWMPNPRYASRVPAGTTMPAVRLGYLFKEFFGIHDPSDLFVYLTDGGHWENTGLVELLRKGDLAEVVCVDADPGPGDAVKSISEAIDLAALECGARVNLQLDPLRAEPATSRAPGYAQRSVTVGFFESAVGRVGLIWYAKPALTVDMPATLLAHRETHPDYPRAPTMDQFFDTSTFIAYRDLGRYNARMIRKARKQLLEDVEAAVRAHASHPGLHETAFDAFAALERRGWAATEIADLIISRTAEPERRQVYFAGLCDALWHAVEAPA